MGNIFIEQSGRTGDALCTRARELLSLHDEENTRQPLNHIIAAAFPSSRIRVELRKRLGPLHRVAINRVQRGITGAQAVITGLTGAWRGAAGMGPRAARCCREGSVSEHRALRPDRPLD